MVFLLHCCLLVPLLSMSNNLLRSKPAPDLTLATYSITGWSLWVHAHETARQLYFLQRSTLSYKGGKIKVNHRILPYDPKVDLKTIQKTICQRLFCTHMYWKNQNLSNNNDNNTAVPSTMQEQAEGRVTMTRCWICGTKVRIHSFLFILTLLLIFLQSLEDWEANIRKYFNGDLKKELLNMLHCLQSAGMNYDITDSESSDQALQSCTHWWLSPSVISILQELDALGKQAKALRLISKKGNQPLPQTMNAKIVYNSTKTISLLKNWYHHEWYEGLCPLSKVISVVLTQKISQVL